MQKLQDKSLIKLSSYINGQWQQGDDYIDIINPANDECIAQVVNAGTEHAEQAIAAAKQAFIPWAKKSASERAHFNAGQTCVCTNRIFVQQKVVEAFTDKFVAEVR